MARQRDVFGSASGSAGPVVPSVAAGPDAGTPSADATTRSSVSQAVRAATAVLSDAGVESPAVEARLLMRYALAAVEGGGAAHTTTITTHPLSPVSDTALFIAADDPAPAGFEEWLRRRASREPLQHIVGSAPFAGLDFFSVPGAFIPRPETELLVEWAVDAVEDIVTQRRATELQAKLFDGEITLVDVCSGPGTIAIAVAHRLVPLLDHGVRVRIVGLEKSSQALELARRNELACGVDPRINLEFLPFDVEEPRRAGAKALVGVADVVVSNPPYVPAGAHVSPEVRQDPNEAVFSGADGLDLMPKVVEIIDLLAAPRAAVAIEHDDSNGEGVQELLRAAGMQRVEQHLDLADRPRFVTAEVQRDPSYIPPRR